MASKNSGTSEQRFLDFHQILFRAQAYNRAFFLEDLAEDFLITPHDNVNPSSVEISDVKAFLKEYRDWEKGFLSRSKAD
ncbi:MAG: hypothetical protein OSA45_12820 [Halioglobus sp.]|nr:hypothetical protein [Halioglobus sp.]